MERVKIGVLLSGSGSNFQSILDATENPDYPGKVVYVASNKQNAFGLERARRSGIPHKAFERGFYSSKEDRDRELFQALQDHEVELVVLAGYLGKIPEFMIDAYENRILNIHPSLLPCFGGRGYFGKRVHQGVYDRGMKISGATVHFVNEETDGGPIILQEAVKIDFHDDADMIQKKVLAIEHRIYPEAIALTARGRVQVIEGRVKIQEEGGV